MRFSVDITALPGGAYVDPTTLVFQIKNMTTNVIVSYTYNVGPTVVKDAVGQYHCDYEPPTAANYTYRWTADGTVAVAAEETITISPSKVV